MISPSDISISHHHLISPYDIYVSQKSNIWHWDRNSLFSFDESLLDAESSLEHFLDTNVSSFLHRFWIRYQNGTTSDLQKVIVLVLQVVLFWIFSLEGYWNHETYVSGRIITIWYLHMISTYDISISHLHIMISTYDTCQWHILMIYMYAHMIYMYKHAINLSQIGR